MIPLNNTRQILTVISEIGLNPGATHLNVGHSVDSVQATLFFLHKSQYLEKNFTGIIYRDIDFSVFVSEEIQNNFATLLFNYKDLNFNSLGYIGQHIKYSYINNPFFQIFPNDLDNSTGSPCLESFFNSLSRENNNNIFTIDFEAQNFLTNQALIQQDINFLRPVFDINSESEDEGELLLFFDWLEFPVNSTDIISVLNNIPSLSLECINYFNYHNTIFYLYENIDLVNLNNLILPVYNRIFNITNINTQFNSLNELIFLKHDIIKFNTQYIIYIKNCLFTKNGGFDEAIIKNIIDFSVDFEMLVEYGLILLS